MTQGNWALLCQAGGAPEPGEQWPSCLVWLSQHPRPLLRGKALPHRKWIQGCHVAFAVAQRTECLPRSAWLPSKVASWSVCSLLRCGKHSCVLLVCGLLRAVAPRSGPWLLKAPPWQHVCLQTLRDLGPVTAASSNPPRKAVGTYFLVANTESRRLLGLKT